MVSGEKSCSNLHSSKSNVPDGETTERKIENIVKRNYLSKSRKK